MSPVFTEPAPAPARSDLAGPLIDVLQQVHDVVVSLTPRQYAQCPVGPVESSVGGHVRHCLDHMTALVAHVTGESSVLNYDRRDRGTSVETSRDAALERILDLQEQLAALSVSGDDLVHMWTSLAPDTLPVTALSSIAREVSFVLSHTIHHNALIAVMVKLLGADTPRQFGLAPSTLAYRNRQHVCAD